MAPNPLAVIGFTDAQITKAHWSRLAELANIDNVFYRDGRYYYDYGTGAALVTAENFWLINEGT